MTPLADNVLNEVLKAVEVPDDLLEFLYLLLAKEEKSGYPAFLLKPKGVTHEHVDVYAYAIAKIIKDLPPFVLVGEGLSIPIYSAMGLSGEDLDNQEFLPVKFRAWEYEETKMAREYPGPHGGPFTFAPYCKFFHEILYFNVGIQFPHSARRKHTQLVGGTGSGKTTLLQQLIANDLKTDASVIVIDSSGDLINTLKHSKLISSERLVIVDPKDCVLNPLSLNMFDAGQHQLAEEDPVEYVGHINNVVSLLNFLFSSVLDFDISGQQSTLLDFCCSLLLKVPNAGIKEFVDLLENGTKPYQEYIDTMSEISQSFFRSAFPEGRKASQYRTTKEAVQRKLMGLMKSDTFGAMFSAPENKFDMAEIMDQGKVLLISTNLGFLGRESCAFFGRYFVSLIAQVALQRDSIVDDKKRHPVYLYIDECQDYFKSEDSQIESLLDKGRKYNVGITLAYHGSDQLDPKVHKAIKGHANIRIVGSPDPSEFFRLQKELKVDSVPDTPGSYAVFVKGSRRGFIARSKLGIIENAEKRTAKEMEAVMEANRAKYCIDGETRYKTPETPVKELKRDEAKGIPEDPLAPYT